MEPNPAQPANQTPKPAFTPNGDTRNPSQQSRTRTMNPGAGSPSQQNNQHRVVLGRGARKIAGVGHVAGARMSIVRKAGKMGRKGPSRPTGPNRSGDVIPPLAPGAIRIVPMGGVEEVGRNMTAIEYMNEIIIVDMGFQFKEEDRKSVV